ncbi:hypothetical protein C8046_16770 [Serinibacter arcticus]|uniref:Endonuclease V n=1 Tax=Serinibacter arcticus TaxID=1655435 RepID=A0A2U2A078_9MICO|nr:hypothetical protein C8046_16770 [Serinibacter arcticus]
MVVAAVDVHYGVNGGATAALVTYADLECSMPLTERVVDVVDVAPYEPGALFKRELPCILAVLEGTSKPSLLVVDGYATLDAAGRPGLGAHASAALGVPVIGVAKTPFRTATHASTVTRGRSTRPLYVTAAGGLDSDGAARIVAGMSGDHRIPTALARVDRLARRLGQPVAHA